MQVFDFAGIFRAPGVKPTFRRLNRAGVGSARPHGGAARFGFVNDDLWIRILGDWPETGCIHGRLRASPAPARKYHAADKTTMFIAVGRVGYGKNPVQRKKV